MEARQEVLYGEANYKSFIEDNGYYVDKTHYIRLLEKYKTPIFLRPRRFGKSLFCTTLEYYYDLNEKENFQTLFGHTDIGKNPTPNHNRYFVLHLDFSGIEITEDMAAMTKSFNYHNNLVVQSLAMKNREYFQDRFEYDKKDSVAANLDQLLSIISTYQLPPLYVIIDEYDNFANQLITSHQDKLYDELLHEKGFLKNFFKILKKGAKNRTIAKIFITGVLPITIDDLASGYNIGQFLTLEEKFECMLGFTQEEVDHLLDQVYEDYEFDPSTREVVGEVIRTQYNGYHPVNPEGTALYNSTMFMYFLEKFCDQKKIPENLTDGNLKTEVSWVKRLTASNPENTQALLNQLMTKNRIPYDRFLLSEKFNMSQFFEKSFYPISFFYLGMLTRIDNRNMGLPNLNMKNIFSEYFNEIYRIDVSTLYAEVMAAFVKQPEIPALFDSYWKLYVSQLPEAIFQQVNENFYRTTFYELCRRHLSLYFSWTVENSSASGRTDLEFIGKFHTPFAGIRFLLEFKYYSVRKMQLEGIQWEKFEALEKDRKQIEKYQKEAKKENSKANIKSFLVYCFANRGFRIFLI